MTADQQMRRRVRRAISPFSVIRDEHGRLVPHHRYVDALVRMIRRGT